MKRKLVVTSIVAALALSALTGCGGKKDDGTITVAASATPHAEILEQVKPILADQGYTLEVTVFNDYVPVSYTHLTLPTK